MLNPPVFDLRINSTPNAVGEFMCYDLAFLDAVVTDAARSLSDATNFQLIGLTATCEVTLDSVSDLPVFLIQCSDVLMALTNPAVNSFQFDFFAHGSEFYLIFERTGAGWSYFIRDHDISASRSPHENVKSFVLTESLVQNLARIVEVFCDFALNSIPALKHVHVFGKWRSDIVRLAAGHSTGE